MLCYDAVMNSKKLISLTVLALAAFAVAGTARAQAGTVEFNVVMTPASGHPEPTMRQMIYLLRQSFATTRKQAEAEEPKPDFDKFVDSLVLTPELKAWMKKTKTTTIMGEPFHNMLKPEDMVGVPEFLNAYVETNLTEAEADLGFPKPKYRAKEKLTKPEKYELERKNYLAAVRKYYEKNPHSADTIDVHLAEWDHTAEWNLLMDAWTRRSRERAIEYSQTREFVAKVETDLQGRGSFRVAPGTYWLSTLEGYAVAGDLHLHWNIPVIVEDGMVTRVELSNSNAERPRR
jgi:hypothetical protein